MLNKIGTSNGKTRIKIVFRRCNSLMKEKCLQIDTEVSCIVLDSKTNVKDYNQL